MVKPTVRLKGLEALAVFLMMLLSSFLGALLTWLIGIVTMTAFKNAAVFVHAWLLASVCVVILLMRELLKGREKMTVYIFFNILIGLLFSVGILTSWARFSLMFCVAASIVTTTVYMKQKASA